MRILWSVLLVLFLAPGYSGEERLPLLGKDAVVRAEPVVLFPHDPGRTKLGGLTWLGGVRLSSPDPAFGGFSSMHVAGDHFLLLSDGGNVVRFRMGPDWQPRDAHFSELPAGPGTGWMKMDRDSESLTADPATGRMWVGFERYNMIWRYGPDLQTVEASAAPKAMADWPRNGGPESLVRLRDGSFLVLAETDRPKKMGGARTALHFDRDPTLLPRTGFRFAYVPPAAGYDPSDMTELPDGRLLVLNRAFSFERFFEAKLTLIDPRDIRPGAVVRGKEIASFTGPVIRDNYEALAVTQEGGATILWIAVDDNLNWFERSLLLKFRLDI